MSIMLKSNHVAFSLLSAGLINIAFAEQSPLDLKREEIVIFSRGGDSQLEQAITQLVELYKRTKDAKVRDDLIALMVRRGQFKEVTVVCSQCNVNSFSESELENLGRAYRSTQNFPKSLQLYTQLRTKYPNNPNGLLGSSLVETELGNYRNAQNHLAQYKRRFGTDAGYQEAHQLFLDKSEPDLAKLRRWQTQLKTDPHNEQVAINLYRLAAKLNVHPIQEELIGKYPHLFTKKDSQWLKHGEAISSIRGHDKLKRRDLGKTYERLTNVIDSAEKGSPIYIQAVQDRLIIASRLGKNAWVRKDYQLLLEQDKDIPRYVQDAYADTLLREGSPFKALDIYKILEASEIAASGRVSTDLLFKLVAASSDAGYFSDAQNYLDQINEGETVRDFTQKSRVVNSNYDRKFYGQVDVDNWRGDKSKAVERLEDRLRNLTPGDPWLMFKLSDIESSRNNHDQATFLVHKAGYFLREEEKIAYQNQRANIALNQGNLRKARKIIDTFTLEEREEVEPLLKRYKEERAGSIVASFGISHQTAPKDKPSNETVQEYYVNSPKTADGHSAYAHYKSEKTPTEDDQILRQSRFGVGVNMNFFPVKVNAEAGKGAKLNRKSYFSLNTDYVLNENWSFNLGGNINGSGTPIKAINQQVYTKDLGFGTIYTHRDLFQIGTGVNAMKFDDGNMRKSFYAWASAQTFKRDRWSLNNSIRLDYIKNKQIDSAWYYNPSKSRDVEFEADLGYYQPMNYGITLTHHLKGSVGQYKQQAHKAQRSWSVSYGHDWKITKKLNLSYEIGRKKNIYDGKPEFNNYGNVNLSLAF